MEQMMALMFPQRGILFNISTVPTRLFATQNSLKILQSSQIRPIPALVATEGRRVEEEPLDCLC